MGYPFYTEPTHDAGAAVTLSGTNAGRTTAVSAAEQRLIVPGLRAGHYLCFFGMHVLTPTVLELLGEDIAREQNHGAIHLTPALARLTARERYLAAELQGRRYDMGLKYGLLTAQLALALHGRDRDEVLSGMVEMLAHRSA